MSQSVRGKLPKGACVVSNPEVFVVLQARVECLRKRDAVYALFQIAVEHLHLLPIRFFFVDELKVSGCGLVDVMRSTIAKNHVQRNVIRDIVDGTRQLRVSTSDTEIDNAVVIDQVLFRCGNQLGDLGFA